MNLFYKKHLFSECLDKRQQPVLNYPLHGTVICEIVVY
ncbi:hypothetical protein LDG_7739 [Legionella drancourtii LLAP12]|uniref:Uncharacterized protein n=1 Tax=Legionella drancourtii LLAP12 TaxID=658187 RepID=G9ER29_9GAMM|nr:hypothetical protein LDG_7739 [Legionella drancourtii LLAP12]